VTTRLSAGAVPPVRHGKPPDHRSSAGGHRRDPGVPGQRAGVRVAGRGHHRGGALAFDARPEASAFLRTRVPSILDLVTPKVVANAIARRGRGDARVRSGVALTVALIGPLPSERMIVGVLLWWEYLLFAVSVVAVAASIVPKSALRGASRPGHPRGAGRDGPGPGRGAVAPQLPGGGPGRLADAAGPLRSSFEPSSSPRSWRWAWSGTRRSGSNAASSDAQGTRNSPMASTGSYSVNQMLPCGSTAIPTGPFGPRADSRTTR
jgi:hypothetical protein